MQPQTAHFSFKIQKPKNPTFWQTCQNHCWNFGLSPNLKSKNPNLQKIQISKWHLHERIGLLDFGSLQEWCLLVEHCYFRGSTALLFRFRLKTLEVTKLHRRKGLAYSWVSPGQKSESQRLSLNAKQNRGHRREGGSQIYVYVRGCVRLWVYTHVWGNLLASPENSMVNSTYACAWSVFIFLIVYLSLSGNLGIHFGIGATMQSRGLLICSCMHNDLHAFIPCM